MTLLFPVVAALLRPRSAGDSATSPQPDSITILVPSHNGGALLPTTLSSINKAISAVSHHSACTSRVLVGADGCTDDTERIAASLGAEVISFPERRGKWPTILRMVESSQHSQWIVLADCGVSWPTDLLVTVLPFLTQEEVIGVAPAYRNDTSGVIERFLWIIERLIKTIESQCGGPVSVHGATVCYRTRELTDALTYLSEHHWLNDDIVIPLALRTLFPSKRIAYAAEIAVREAGKPGVATSREFIRRRRLVLGNIQWIHHLWGATWKQNYIAAILASRRIFRLLWGYWALGSAGTVALNAGLVSLPGPYLCGLAILLTVLFTSVKQLRALLQSAVASLLAPYYFFVAIRRTSPSTYVTPWN